MIDKTEAQPEALRLANQYDHGDPTAHTNSWKTQVCTELRRQHAELERLRALAATCYAGLGGECDLPVIWLDALNDAANGEAFDTDGLLPYTSAIRVQLVAQTNRAAAAEQQVTALTQRLDMGNRLNTDAREQQAQRAAREPLTELQQQALGMYKPPFQFHHGYIFDSAGHMFADEGRPDEAASLIAVRIRGWGRLGKLSNGAEVQDAAGQLVVDALNAFWKQYAIGAKK